MAIVKQNHQLENAVFKFNEVGEVEDVVLTVNIQLYDDVADKELTRMRETKSIWSGLTSAQQNQGNIIGKKLQSLAKSFQRGFLVQENKDKEKKG